MNGPVNLSSLGFRKVKLALAAAIAAFALGGAGLAMAAAVTPTPKAPHPAAASHHSTTSNTADGNSANAFGQQVKAHVATCKTQRPTSGGKQGIGECISTWVKAHNPSNTNGHGASSNTGH